MDEISDRSISLNADALDEVNGEEKGIILSESNVNEPSSMFDTGDIVWVKTLTQMWWPGMISNPSATKKAKKEGCLFVKYIANAGSIWCSSSDLKPFLRYFDEMSTQISARIFYSSVEKALSLAGLRIKANMTCPCFKKREEAHYDQMTSQAMSKGTNFNVLSPSQFDPRVFFMCIRDMACSNRVYDKVEVTTTKNCLSAFYSSVGHCDLLLHHILKPADRDDYGAPETRTRVKRKRNSDSGVDKALATAGASSGKGSESRERKKSKYLSYPYINAKNNASSPSETKEIKLGSSQICGKNRQKKSDKGGLKVSKAEIIDASASELLAELHSTARDCSHPKRTCSNEDQATKQCKNREVDVTSATPEVENRVTNEFEKSKMNVSSATDCEMGNLTTKGNQIDMPTSFRSTPNSGVTVRKMNPDIVGIEQKWTDMIPKVNKMAHLPDLNGHISVEKSVSNDFGDSASKQGSKESSYNFEKTVNGICFGSITSLKDAQLALQCSRSLNSTPNLGNASFGSSLQHKFPMTLYPSVVESKYKKRKQKEKAHESVTDLSENISEKRFSGTNFSDQNIAFSQEENKSSLSNGESPIGGSIILKFSHGYTLPPKETLVSTFSRFGLLKDSKFETIDESTIRVLYERSSEARFAFRSLEKNKPFGTALSSFELDCPEVIMRPVKKRIKNHSMTLQQSSPLIDPVGIQTKANETPNVAFMKQNVEMMKLTLEKAGANLSPEMKAKLENEIKVFLDKIGS